MTIKWTKDGKVDRSHWNARTLYMDSTIPNGLADALDRAVGILSYISAMSYDDEHACIPAECCLRDLGVSE